MYHSQRPRVAPSKATLCSAITTHRAAYDGEHLFVRWTPSHTQLAVRRRWRGGVLKNVIRGENLALMTPLHWHISFLLLVSLSTYHFIFGNKNVKNTIWNSTTIYGTTHPELRPNRSYIWRIATWYYVRTWFLIASTTSNF